MSTYDELLERYKKRKNETLVDTITTGLTCADEVAVQLGLFDSFSIFTHVIDNVLDIIPFLIIVATEGSKVILGKKKVSKAVKDASYRSIKSGTAMAVGAGVTAIGGGILALPAAVSVRFFFDKYKSKAMLKRRLEDRITTMNYLREKWDHAYTGEIPLIEAEIIS
ncbi:MAG: hypothetical protein FWC47_00995 [Oscillospiraceae bacterium]|nr:hypothetical protein [Oscillospiraceae bacterium]